MPTDAILAGLNEPQLKAVMHQNGPVLILAGAGSGKTKALTHRIAALIESGVEPWQILAVTFTNKAANEMKERIKNLVHTMSGSSLEQTANPMSDVPGPKSDSARLPVMGTFHSVCVRILRRDIEHLGRDRNFVIYDTDDQEKLMKEILKEMKVDEKELKARAALGYIGRFKSEGLSPREAMNQATTARMATIIQAYERYQKALFSANALDFDDLILETVRLFHEAPKVLERYQRTWKYLHVDEYQDTNHAQYLMITMLANQHRNLCVIGDPDQSIYSFRGADIRNIMEFKNEYPDALEIKLEQNYRSTQIILEASNKVISANPNRPEKEMWTTKKEGPLVVIQEVRDERKEADEVVARAVKLRSEGLKLNDQVVLYRTNAQSRQFEEACLRAGIPYRILGGLKFYMRREVKDVLAYLHTVLNPIDTVSLLRIINVPSRKIGDTTLGHVQAFGSERGFSLWSCLKIVEEIQALNEPVRERLRRFITLMEEYQQRSHNEVVSRLTKNLLQDIGMEQWLKDGTDEGEDRWQNVLELLSVMQKYDQLAPRDSLLNFLEEASLVSEVDKLSDVRDDALTLMTLHLAKGLEFEHVMIAGCEEGIFPHSSSLFDREQLEEERRLMYVGMTRARMHLCLLLARSRTLWGNVQANAPSRFLDDLPDSVVERRSDELLSAFAWASESGQRQAWGNDREGSALGSIHRRSRTPSVIEPFHQHADEDFNQDTQEDVMNQDVFTEGSRVSHPKFGEGKILTKRGDIVNVQFDSGVVKTLALSIAPLKAI